MKSSGCFEGSRSGVQSSGLCSMAASGGLDVRCFPYTSLHQAGTFPAWPGYSYGHLVSKLESHSHQSLASPFPVKNELHQTLRPILISAFGLSIWI